MSGSLAMARPASRSAVPDRVPSPAPPVRTALTAADYLGQDGTLTLVSAEAETYADPEPGSLFSHPAWLRAYGAGDLVIVEARPGRRAPRLVFTRERGGLVHQGRLFHLDSGLVGAVSDRLMAQARARFVVFEDVEITSPLPRGQRHLAFRYQNNWRLALPEAEARIPKKLLANTKRRLRNLVREKPDVTVGFADAPERGILDAITTFGRIRIEGQGRRYGIDDAEVARLAAVAAEIGHSTVMRMGEAVLAADVVYLSGDQAYFMMHGYDPGYHSSGLGMLTLINSIEACTARGLLDFNLMWGDLPYKEQIGATCIPLQTVVTRRSRLGLLWPGHLATVRHFGWLDLKRRLKPTVGRLRTLRARLKRGGSGVRSPGTVPE